MSSVFTPASTPRAPNARLPLISPLDYGNGVGDVPPVHSTRAAQPDEHPPHQHHPERIVGERLSVRAQAKIARRRSARLGSRRVTGKRHAAGRFSPNPKGKEGQVRVRSDQTLHFQTDRQTEIFLLINVGRLLARTTHHHLSPSPFFCFFPRVFLFFSPVHESSSANLNLPPPPLLNLAQDHGHVAHRKALLCLALPRSPVRRGSSRLLEARCTAAADP